MNYLSRLEKSKEFWFLLGTAVVFFLLRLPSLIEPHWYGDEGVYEVLGLALDKGRILYTQIWDNKPPLLYYTYALFQADQGAVKFASLIGGLAAVIAFYFLAKKLLNNRRASFVSTGFFALFFALPIFEGNIANAENFMLFPIILAGLLIYKHVATTTHHKHHTQHLFLAGLLLGIAFLYKIVAVFDFAAFFIFLSIMLLPEKATEASLRSFLRKNLTTYGLFVLGFLLPFALSLLYFLFHGALSTYLQAIFFSNVGYVGYKNAFLIPQGLLFIKVVLLVVTVIIVSIKRQKLSPAACFLILWIAFSLFNAFFSQRPYTHYLLVMLPSFSLLIGWILLTRKSKRFAVLATIIIAYILLTSFNHWGIRKTLGYYTNYFQFITRQKPLSSYQTFFDRRVPADMALVGYLNQKTKPSDTIFLWGNDPQVYALTDKLPPGRFTVAYHITATKDNLAKTKQAIEQSKPAYIAIYAGVSPYPYHLYNYRYIVSIKDIAIYERVL